MKKNKRSIASGKSGNKSVKKNKSDKKKIEPEMEKLNFITDKIFSYTYLKKPKNQ